jgi:predicted ribosome quality control (RQC) complex YloA/Tae2 family protein
MAFDGIVTKSIVNELNILIDSKIDKIYEPNKNTILIGLYGNRQNYALNICIDSSNYRINLTTHSKPNPNVAPNFCMLLRKHLIGSYLRNIEMNSLERVVIFNLETLNDFNEIICKKLVVELMGKHSNIILLDENGIILDSIRHSSISSSSYRDILPNRKYEFPKTDKLDFLSISTFDEFYNIIKSDLDIKPLSKILSDKFNGISNSFVDFHIKNLNITNNLDDLRKLFEYLKNILASNNLKFVDLKDEENITKDYVLTTNELAQDPLSLNFFIDDYYFSKESSQDFKSYRNSILKLILDTLKKYNKRLENICSKLSECEKMDTYKLYGELLTANLYKFNGQNLEVVSVENYYDNNNIINIPLDKKYNVNINAKNYFKKYNKLKNTLEIVSKQKQETISDLDYLESIVYELENSSSISDIQDIFEEISENDLFKKGLSKKEKNKKSSKKPKAKIPSFNPIIYEIEEYKVYVGRNNKENDILTLKFADKNDIWFHTKDIHGSHVILKLNTPKDTISEDILLKCAKITAEHSKAKNSYNVPVDYCKVQYVKKPSKAKPGMVIYSNNKTLYVNP